MASELNQLSIKLNLKVSHGLGEDLNQLDLNTIETNTCLALSKTLFRAIGCLANGRDDFDDVENIDLFNLSNLGVALIEKLEDTIDLNELESFRFVQSPIGHASRNGNKQ